MKKKIILIIAVFITNTVMAWIVFSPQIILYCIQHQKIFLLKECLYLGGNANTRLEGGVTPLMVASSMGRIAAVKLLLAHGAEVNARDCDNWTALMLAVNNNRFQIVEMLLNNKANPNLGYSNKGYTLLMLATLSNFSKIVEILLEYKANVDALAGCRAEKNMVHY
ncbi:MAG: ankyrin repeat domain-containing protein [Victivallaceae bacterium]|jgi:ankyrin repeat protein